MKKILLVDDEPYIIAAYSQYFKSKGYDVSVAKDGVEALSQIKKVKPKLVLLDIIMPKLNGFEVLECLQKIDNRPTVYVLSNLSQPSDEREAKNLGAKKFIVKSNITIEELGKQVALFFKN